MSSALSSSPGRAVLGLAPGRNFWTAVLGTTARHIFDRFWTVTFVKIRQLDGQWIETYLNVDSAQLRVLEALGLPAGASP